MHIINLQHQCGHRQEWLMPCGYQTARVYGIILASEECPRCAARHGAAGVARYIMDEYHRTLCSRQQPPDTAPIFVPARRRRRAS